MNIFVDIEYSFIRQPIKLAIANSLKETVTFVGHDSMADLIIGIPEYQYHKPCILLSDDPHQFIIQDNVLAICPTPTNTSEMETLVMKVTECLRLLR